ncbi:MAG: hypothetical protein OXR66_08535 [Candidatus Woesearchaeota archaeon]|nr:hypothetical protein [Candidatus Woesearchaeota archaeon]
MSTLTIKYDRDAVQNTRERIQVSSGKVEHSKDKPLYSRNFYRCCPVALDYGDEALFAHAVPNEEMAVSIPHIVQLLKRESRKLGLDLQSCTGVVDASSHGFLTSILDQFAAEDIPFVAHLQREEWFRDALYIPGVGLRWY